jgi:predicted membrane protein
MNLHMNIIIIIIALIQLTTLSGFLLGALLISGAVYRSPRSFFLAGPVALLGSLVLLLSM